MKKLKTYFDCKDSRGGYIAEPVTEKQRTEYNPQLGVECSECQSIDLDFSYLQHYNIKICLKCVKKDEYSLLTKTEAKQDYLLTESEIKSLQCWVKPNPHKSSYSNMLLYCRKQVEEFAIKKWKSLELLDQEFASRELKKQKQKDLKFKRKMRELRTKTTTILYQEPDHQHVFQTRENELECTECGYKVECTTI